VSASCFRSLKKRDRKRFTLNANLEAVAFYEATGFRAHGPERSEKGLLFLPMVLERGVNRAGSGP
jgi:predicted GNAT family N-acyltransferase